MEHKNNKTTFFITIFVLVCIFIVRNEESTQFLLCLPGAFSIIGVVAFPLTFLCLGTGYLFTKDKENKQIILKKIEKEIGNIRKLYLFGVGITEKEGKKENTERTWSVIFSFTFWYFVLTKL